MDDETKPFTSSEPSYEWDYDNEPGPQPKVLWGRVVVLFLFLLIAFLIGRWTAGGESGDAAALQRQLNEANAEIEDLTEELEAQEEQPAAVVTETPGATETPPAEEGEGETYVVKQGDTLRGIATCFYGDPALDDVIMEANGIDDPENLSIGDELIIPAREELQSGNC